MNITFDFACRDDCLDKMVPSDLRELVAERDRLLQQREVGMELSKQNITLIQELIAERDLLRKAIEKHRHNVWGDGDVEHDEDVALYGVLEGE